MPTKRKALAWLCAVVTVWLLMHVGGADTAATANPEQPQLQSELAPDTFTPSERITLGTCETTCYYGRVDS